MPRCRRVAAMAAPGTAALANESPAHIENASPEGHLVAEWSDDPWVTVPLVLCIGLYLIGRYRVARRSRRGAPRLHAVAFLTGSAALAVALVSPLDALGGELFSAHMLQHEALMLIAAPLLIVSKPLGVLAWGMPHGWSRSIAKTCTIGPLPRLWRYLTRPLTAWCVHALALWVWHAPVLFEASLGSDSIHTWQHVSFLVSAILFWWALLRRAGHLDPVLYIFTTLLHTGMLGMLLTFSTTPWYPHYLDTAPRWGLTALEDQQLGGLVMWVPAGALLTAAGLVMFGHWLRKVIQAPPPPSGKDHRS